MAGASTHIAYVSDDGNTYRALVPAWVAGLTGDPALATGAQIPKGYRRRHRYIRNTTSGREYKFTVGAAGSAAYTAAFGAAVATGHVPTLLGPDTWVYAGRSGEKDKIRG
jgi:hypothetical protein